MLEFIIYATRLALSFWFVIHETKNVSRDKPVSKGSVEVEAEGECKDNFEADLQSSYFLELSSVID